MLYEALDNPFNWLILFERGRRSRNKATVIDEVLSVVNQLFFDEAFTAHPLKVIDLSSLVIKIRTTEVYVKFCLATGSD